MDEPETKTCLNCKREIPAVNFTIHSVHCARNIKICPVCKEPVPHAELQEHHEKMHKLLPCKKCGESVCGTDLEDHVRDSCAHTIKSCRFCELELPRREIPAHENYCGVRTEQCADCREWVMLKYRQLHVDSNHGFIRLDDEPAPQPKKELAKLTRIPKPMNTQPSAGWSSLAELTAGAEVTNGFLKNTNLDRPRTEIRRLRPSSSAEPIAGGSGAGGSGAGGGAGGGEGSSQAEGQRLPVKRTNDQPQINTNVAATDKVNKDLNMSRGAVKKRPAPKPPSVPAPDPRRDHAYYSAMQRQQDEERQRAEQTAINLARGLPPVLSAAAKLERLRKMDALHNRETEAEYTRQGPSRLPQPEEPTRLQPSPDGRHGLPDRGNEFSNLKPMSPDEFMRRFNALQMQNSRNRAELPQAEQRESGLDRFSEIKSSLRELRRGLNEVTAPYNANSVNNDLAPERNNGDRFSSSSSSGSDAEQALVQLPCEFCDRPVPLHDLVRHQTGCRPDLAQVKAPRLKLRPHETQLQQELQHQQQLQQQQLQQQQELLQHEQLLAAAIAAAEEHEDMHDLPVIPCEFCTESLPVYLISEHQERCRRDSHDGPMLYPD